LRAQSKHELLTDDPAGHVPSDHEGDPSKHAPSLDAGEAGECSKDSLGKILVEGHRYRRTATGRSKNRKSSAVRKPLIAMIASPGIVRTMMPDSRISMAASGSSMTASACAETERASSPGAPGVGNPAARAVPLIPPPASRTSRHPPS